MTKCQLVKPYGLAPKFTHRRGMHIGWQSLMMLCYTRVTFLDASNARKFYCLEIVATAMAGVAGALHWPCLLMKVGNLQSLALSASFFPKDHTADVLV